MIITVQAPTRLGLFGSGTDTEPFASKYGGKVINLAINIRQQIVVGKENKLLDTDNPDFFKAFTDLPVEHKFDGFIHAGLGTSAAIAVALVGATSINMSREEIAEEAWDIEVNKLKMFGGRQDQYASVFGGLNLFTFDKDVRRIPFSRNIADELSKYLLLFDTGIKRSKPNIQENLLNLDDRRVKALLDIKEIANKAYHLINTRNFKKVGELLDLSWRMKKKSNRQMTNFEIDNIYEMGKQFGATGGKLCGSGGGGFMIFWVEPSLQYLFKKRMGFSGVKHYDFSPDYQGLDVRRLN